MSNFRVLMSNSVFFVSVFDVLNPWGVSMDFLVEIPHVMTIFFFLCSTRSYTFSSSGRGCAKNIGCVMPDTIPPSTSTMALADVWLFHGTSPYGLLPSPSTSSVAFGDVHQSWGELEIWRMDCVLVVGLAVGPDDVGMDLLLGSSISSTLHIENGSFMSPYQRLEGCF